MHLFLLSILVDGKITSLIKKVDTPTNDLLWKQVLFTFLPLHHLSQPWFNTVRLVRCIFCYLVRTPPALQAPVINPYVLSAIIHSVRMHACSSFVNRELLFGPLPAFRYIG
jgi:hypothetical protein